LTNEQGVAVVDTIYPGWYRGRATHIHVKVHINVTFVTIDGIVYIKGGHVSHTGQLFFNDTLTDEVAKLSPYKLHKIRRTRNDEDDIYRQSEGSTTIIPIQFLTPAGLEGPVKGDMTLGVDPNAVPPPGGKRPRPSSRR
jgi:protocatechuate 3,4-dioxygenase beta subunit